VRGGNVDLLDLVAADHDETGHLASDDRHRRVAHPGGRAHRERLRCAEGGQRLGHMAGMAVVPAVMPDVRDDIGVVGRRGAQLDICHVRPPIHSGME
jgi:hypothetical protein